MKTHKIKLFKPWHKALIAGIWVGATAWIFANVFHGAITPTRVLTIIAYSGVIGAFITAFPYTFLRNYLARKAGIPMTAGGAGWDEPSFQGSSFNDDDGHGGVVRWEGHLCFGYDHTRPFVD